MILSIDPSDTRHAWALVAPGPQLLAHGRDLDRDPLPDIGGADVVIEMIASYGMPVGANVFDTCVNIGRLLSRFPGARRLTRCEVKLSVCRVTRASDPHVRQAVIDRFGGPAAIRRGGALRGVAGDTWAAVAVALAAMDPEARWYCPAGEWPAAGGADGKPAG